MGIGRIILSIICTYFLTDAFTSVLGSLSLRIGDISVPPALLLFLLLGVGIYLCWKMLRVCITIGVIALILSLCLDNSFFDKVVPDSLPELSVTEGYEEEESFRDLADRILPGQEEYREAIDRAYTHRESSQSGYICVQHYFTPGSYDRQVETFSKEYTPAGDALCYDVS